MADWSDATLAADASLACVDNSRALSDTVTVTGGDSWDA
jgi:hypothetical protein